VGGEKRGQMQKKMQREKTKKGWKRLQELKKIIS
jgi:hypothetical protein